MIPENLIDSLLNSMTSGSACEAPEVDNCYSSAHCEHVEKPLNFLQLCANSGSQLSS